MKKLTKNSFSYLKIVYILYALFDYYAKLFQIDAGDSPVDIANNSDIYEEDGKTFIRFILPVVDKSLISHSVFDIQKIFNDYIRIVLLPHQRILKPYCNGTDNNIYNLIEPLFIDSVVIIDNYMTIDVLYIDNPISYRHARCFEHIDI